MADEAATGTGHAGFLSILDEIRMMHQRKAADYGTGVDPLANVRASLEFGIPAWLGAVIRANDKMQRLKAYAIKRELANESVEDSLLDLAAYSIIALALHRESIELARTNSRHLAGIADTSER